MTTPAATASDAPRMAPGIAAAAIALLFWAGPSVIGKALPLGAVKQVFFRGIIGALWATAVLYARGGRLSLRLLRYSFLGGLALGCDLILFYAAIKETTVANATVISSVQPLIMVFAAPLFFQEKVRLPDFMASLVAILGVVMVVSGSHRLDAWSLKGDLLAVCVLFAWAAYLVASKKAREHLSATEFTCGVMIFSMGIVTPLAVWQGNWELPTQMQWLALTFMAVSGWVGHVLMNWALEHIPLWVGGTSALAVPVLTSGLAAMFLSEPLAPIQIAGMMVVLGSLTVVVLRADKVRA